MQNVGYYFFFPTMGYDRHKMRQREDLKVKDGECVQGGSYFCLRTPLTLLRLVVAQSSGC